ncbi:hypothetical protein RRG08_037418 [Elysia crispata]|uniref:Uncharacterized protein n=1 Tax=Elysia crispata TaxID=231223 RepID=A0AAE1AFL4_9GAST|nr:hypothetical protein RRG08_037418 [Elysia crispata]
MKPIITLGPGLIKRISEIKVSFLICYISGSRLRCGSHDGVELRKFCKYFKEKQPHDKVKVTSDLAAMVKDGEIHAFLRAKLLY